MQVMTNRDYVQKTIDLFEDSLSGPAPIVSVLDLAARIGYSAHHLGRLFQALCGEALGRYMLRRRLAEAARRIRDAGWKAAETAVRLGWEDYSAFSRAVKKEFGLSPAALRQGGGQLDSAAVRARPRLLKGADLAGHQPQVLERPALHVSGLVFNMGPNEKTFHRAWRIFAAHAPAIRGRVGQASYQFSSWTEKPAGSDEGIWIHCAVETEAEAVQDEIFFSQTIPAERVLTFVHQGSVEELFDLYRWLWQEYLPQSSYRLSGCREYQRYPDPLRPELMEICLPVL